MTAARPARPRAFRLDDGGAVIEDQPDAYALEAERAEPHGDAIVQQAQRRGIAARTLLSASGLFWSAAFGLALLALGAWFTQLVEGLFARTPALGWLGLALLVVAALALLVMLAREVRGVLRQRRIATLHGSIARAREADDREAARSLMRELAGLYEGRAETAGARAHVRPHRHRRAHAAASAGRVGG